LRGGLIKSEIEYPKSEIKRVFHNSWFSLIKAVSERDGLFGLIIVLSRESRLP